MEITDLMAQRSKEIIDEKRRLLSEGDEAFVQQVGASKDLMSILRKHNLARHVVMQHETTDPRCSEEKYGSFGGREALGPRVDRSAFVSRPPSYLHAATLMYQSSRTFTLAGMDTTSNALCRVLHILAERPEVQAQLREELADAHTRFGNDIPYDDLVKLPYLGAVCRETLRLYPPVTITVRR